MEVRTFINYRREDPGARAFVGRLYDHLIDENGKGTVFLDEATIPPGANFVAFITEEIDKVDALLAVIGPKWSEILRLRFDDPEDFVRVEIETAFELGKVVVPILMDQTEMPVSEDLPASISYLSQCNAIHLDSGVNFHLQVGRLIESLKGQSARATGDRVSLAEFAGGEIRTLREHFEKRLVRAAEEKLQGLSTDEVMALEIGDGRRTYPSRIGEYPAVLKCFLRKETTREGDSVKPAVLAPLMATLTDTIIEFYKEHVRDIVSFLQASNQTRLAGLAHQTLAKKLEEESFEELFRTCVQEVIGESLLDTILAAFVSVAVGFAAAVGIGIATGTSTGWWTFGVGALAGATVILWKAVRFKGAFIRRVSADVRHASSSIFDEVNGSDTV